MTSRTAVARSARRWVAGVASATMLALSFAVSSTVGVLLHADTPIGRRLAARWASQALSGIFRGEMSIPEITHFGPNQIAASKAVAYDTRGAQVLVLHDLRVSANLLTILRNALSGKEKLTVVIPHIRVERAEVVVIPDEETGEPTIARAFAPRSATDEDATRELDDDRSLRVWMPLIEVGRATGRVAIEGAPPFDARVAGVRGQMLVSPKGLAVNVFRFGTTVRGLGKGDARGTATLRARSPGAVLGTFRGFYGDIEFDAFGRIHNGQLDVVLETPGASPDAVGAIVPGWPLQHPVSGRIEARGKLPEVGVVAHLAAGGARADATGSVWLSEPPRADLEVRVRNFNLQSIWPTAPRAWFDVSTHVEASFPNDELVVALDGRTEPAMIAGQRLPAAQVRGTLGADGFSGQVRLEEPGMPIDADVAISSDGKIDVDARVPRFSLDNPRLPEIGTGTGSGEVRASIDGKSLTARVSANVRDFRRGPVSVASSRVHATLRGSTEDLSRLQVRASLSGTGARFEGMTYSQVEASVDGRFPSARFEVALRDEDRLARAEGKLTVAPEFRLSNVALEIDQSGLKAESTLSEFVPERGIVDIDDLRVTGLGGEARGNVTVQPGLFEADLSAENIDLAQAARLLGLSSNATGTLRLNGTVAIGKDVTRGRIRLQVGNAFVPPVSGLSMELTSRLDGRRVTGEMSGLVAHVGTFGGSWDATLAGTPLEAESWTRATGKADITLSDVQLLLVGLWLGPDTPVRQIGGKGYARFLVERKDPATPPNVFATAATRDLLLDVDRQNDPVRVRGIDLHATSGLNGATGDLTGTVLLMDEVGELLTTSGAIRLDIPALAFEPERRVKALMDTPLDVVLRVPSRAISQLPEFIRPEDLIGAVEGTLHVKGTLHQPTLFASAHVSELSPPDEAVSAPLDLRLNAEYDPVSDRFHSQGAATVRNARVARASASGEWIGEPGAPWLGEARLDLEGLPLSAVPPFSGAGMTGKVVGSALLRRARRASTLNAAFRLEDTALGNASPGGGHLNVEALGNDVRAELRFDGERGHLRAEAETGLNWQGPIPVVDGSRGFKGRISAEDYDASTLQPFFGEDLERLSGSVDAELRFDVHRAPDATKWSGGVDGVVSMQGGNVLIVPLGLELRDTNFTAAATSDDGRTRVAVRGLRAMARSPKHNLFGSADLEFHGPLLLRGTAKVDVDELPLLLQGVSQGRATGTASAKLTRQSNYMQVEIMIPELVARLPRASSRAVIGLQDNPDVRVLQYADEAIEPDRDALPWQLILALGDDVRFRRSDVDIGVRGSPIVEIGRRTSVVGSVSLSPGGRVPILGQVFVIQHGEVHFDTGDPSDPRVDVTAEWRAFDGTMVYVDVTGTLSDADVSLRSDPPLPEPQVFALLLGGSSGAEDPATIDDDQQSTGGAAAGAVGIGSGVAALGLNELLGDSPVEFRVATTRESRPRYTAAVRVGENLWFEASTYQMSSPQVGSDDRNVVSGTIDYRFTRKWSLRTEVGTAGGAMDLLWQHRY